LVDRVIRKAPKPKTCQVCKSIFTPAYNLLTARVCSSGCAVSLGNSKKAKAAKIAAVKDKRETKLKLDKHKSKAKWAAEAQVPFNRYIRLRDAAEPCISCGRHHGGQYHAGHYLSIGARPELRFEELNVAKQCAPCNNHLSGNAVLFRKALLEKHGSEVVDWLEGHHPTRHYSVDYLKQIKADYTAKAKALKEVQQ
jgi:hypothetical protein